MQKLLALKAKAKEEAAAAAVAAAAARGTSNLGDNLNLNIDAEEIELHEKLGDGRFGEVWKGSVYALNVAVKIPYVQDLEGEALERFKQQLSVMNTPHPNTVLYMGACSEPGRFRIVTELMDGNLRRLLRSHQRLSLYEKMDMARCAALALTWLHCFSDPPIIHGNLTTSNLLYNMSGNKFTDIKLTGFGLSQINQSDTLRCHAPEVLGGSPADEKSDVYSFGLVLWEFLTHLEPFSQLTNEQFVEVVLNRNERPPIPSNCPAVLRTLIEECWQPDPKKRPNFKEIAERMDVVVVHSAISDAVGRSFWERYFLKEGEVNSKTFFRKLYSHYRKPLPKDTAPMEVISPYLTLFGTSTERPTKKPANELRNKAPLTKEALMELYKLRGLKALLVQLDSTKQNSVVSVERFGKILEWFGPLLEDNLDTFLDRIHLVLTQPWFHGAIETAEAERRLSDQPQGTFLVRFSNNPDHPGAYTISRVTTPQLSIGHIRITHAPGQGFSINDERDYPSLGALVQDLQSAGHLRTACLGSKYLSLFNLE
ncbi:Dual specificity protein kinase [Balamuthia mandrillaris]